MCPQRFSGQIRSHESHFQLLLPQPYKVVVGDVKFDENAMRIIQETGGWR